MYTWVVYDISKDGQRTKISNRCLQMGLQRVQKSVFWGKIPKRMLKQFELDVPQLINFKTDRLFIVPMNKKQHRNMLRFGVPLPSLPQKGQALFF